MQRILIWSSWNRQAPHHRYGIIQIIASVTASERPLIVIFQITIFLHYLWDLFFLYHNLTASFDINKFSVLFHQASLIIKVLHCLVKSLTESKTSLDICNRNSCRICWTVINLSWLHWKRFLHWRKVYVNYPGSNV